MSINWLSLVKDTPKELVQMLLTSVDSCLMFPEPEIAASVQFLNELLKDGKIILLCKKRVTILWLTYQFKTTFWIYISTWTH